jgi:hypothetical protein
MGQTKCNACGRAIEAGIAVVHQIVPEEAKELFGISDLSTTILCNGCSKEVIAWYQKRISSVTYDSNIKRFRVKSPAEMAGEYYKVYQSFANFRGKRRKRKKII